jgi:hypothetical protein
MQTRVNDILANFPYAAASYEFNDEKVRTLVKLSRWDEAAKKLWCKFPSAIPSTSFDVLLKCVDKKRNIYVLIRGTINSTIRNVNDQNVMQPVWVKEITVAKRLVLDEQVSDFKILQVIDYLKPETPILTRRAV